MGANDKTEAYPEGGAAWLGRLRRMTNPLCDLKVIESLSLKVVEASPDASIVIDEKGRIVIFNYQAELMFGYPREEVIGQPVEVLMPEEKRQSHADKHRPEYFRSPRVREMGAGRVLEGRRYDGSVFPIEIKLSPLPPVAGAGIHALAVVRRVNDPVLSQAMDMTRAASAALAGKRPELPAPTQGEGGNE